MRQLVKTGVDTLDIVVERFGDVLSGWARERGGTVSTRVPFRLMGLIVDHVPEGTSRWTLTLVNVGDEFVFDTEDPTSVPAPGRDQTAWFTRVDGD